MPCAPDEPMVQPQDICPEKQFREAAMLIKPLLPKAMHRAGGIDALAAHYMQVKRDAAMECLDKPVCAKSDEKDACRWAASTRKTGQIINLGEGSTGTRFLTCLMGELKFVTEHNIQTAKDPYCLDQKECTPAWDAYDYINDWPVPDLASALIATHTGDSLGGVLLSLRDPLEWREKRYSEHKDQDSGDWQAAAPCSATTAFLKNDTANWDLLKLTYDSFAACVAIRDRDPKDLFAFNLWEYDDEEAEFPVALHKWLKGRSVWASPEDLTLKHVEKAYAACYSQGLTRDSDFKRDSRGVVVWDDDVRSLSAGDESPPNSTTNSTSDSIADVSQTAQVTNRSNETADPTVSSSSSGAGGKISK